MVCTKLLIGLRRRIVALCVARAVERRSLLILVSLDFLSTSVSKPPLCPALTTVSPSQSPRRALRATMAGRSEMSILFGIRPRPAIVARKARLGDWEGDTVV